MGNNYNGDAYAPYNFVPFSKEIENVPKPYSSLKDIVGDIAEKKTDRLSGYIEFDINLETPLYIGGLKEDDEEMPFKDGNGNVVIPGSTIRGLIKSHVEMLSFSYPQIEDRRFMYRKFADESKRVRDEYAKKMKGSVDSRNLIGVKCGIIFKDDVGEYFIQPLENFEGLDKNFISVHETDLRDQDLLKDNQYMYYKRIKKFKESGKEIADYKEEIKAFKNKNYRVYRNREQSSFSQNGKLFTGILLNSEWMNGKTHHYLVSCVEKGEPIPVNKKDILNYIRDYDVNCIQNKKLEENKSFYALPEKSGKEKNGKIFFYKIKEDGKILGFGPTQYFRIFYDNSVAQGIPYRNDQSDGYDYAQALFGFIENGDNDQNSMKSRLSFQNVTAANPVAKKDLDEKKLELLSPKGTAFQLYLEQKGKNISNLNTYNGDFCLRGYKMYLKRKDPIDNIKNSKSGEKGNNNSNSNRNKNEKIRSRCVFLPPDKISFKKVRIYYENLKADELGILLLAIKYDASKKESHMIGHAKPYGYGKVMFENPSLFEFDPEKRFSNIGWNSNGDDISAKIEQYKEVYKEKISTLLNIEKREYEELPTVKAYREYISLDNMDKCLNESKDSIYMDIKKNNAKPTYGNRNILPDWDKLMEKYRNH